MTEYEEVAPGVKKAPSGAIYIYDEEAYEGPSPRGFSKDEDGLTVGEKKTALSNLLDDYVAPPFEGGADYEEVHIESVNPEFETVVMFDENDEVTVDPTLARIEAGRLLHETE